MLLPKLMVRFVAVRPNFCARERRIVLWSIGLDVEMYKPTNVLEGRWLCACVETDTITRTSYRSSRADHYMRGVSHQVVKMGDHGRSNLISASSTILILPGRWQIKASLVWYGSRVITMSHFFQITEK